MGHEISLSSFSTIPENNFTKDEANEANILLIGKLSHIQDKLYAQKKYGVLIIFQGMDTSGKDSAVKHVFSGVNPAGCKVKSFKVPTTEETAHHFLWRISKECPEKGMIQIFNRSHYEDILVPFIQKTMTNNEMADRCEEINRFETGLINNNTIVIKFLLNISHTEQISRLKDRKTDRKKNWKYSKEDVIDIGKHEKYEKAYNLILEKCSTTLAFNIIPADKKWFKNYSILKHIVHVLDKYTIEYPKMPE